MSFAQNLEYLLAQNSMTRYRFSKLTGYSQTTVANWISGKTKPYSKDREAIAAVFHITVEELMDNNLPPIKKETPATAKDSWDIVMSEFEQEVIELMRREPEVRERIKFEVEQDKRRRGK